MTTDLTVTGNDELMVAQVEGNTHEGVAFVDSYNHLKLVAVDAGRIILPAEAIAGFLDAAKAEGLTWETPGEVIRLER